MYKYWKWEKERKQIWAIFFLVGLMIIIRYKNSCPLNTIQNYLNGIYDLMRKLWKFLCVSIWGGEILHTMVVEYNKRLIAVYASLCTIKVWKKTIFMVLSSKGLTSNIPHMVKYDIFVPDNMVDLWSNIFIYMKLSKSSLII